MKLRLTPSALLGALLLTCPLVAWGAASGTAPTATDPAVTPATPICPICGGNIEDFEARLERALDLTALLFASVLS